MTQSAEDLQYNVVWSVEDNEFVATTPSFPSLSWLDQDKEKAVAGLKAVVAEILNDTAV